jgi:hypothetical protein
MSEPLQHDVPVQIESLVGTRMIRRLPAVPAARIAARRAPDTVSLASHCNRQDVLDHGLAHIAWSGL